VDGIGFHCLEVEEDQLVAEQSPPEHEAIVIAGENRLTCDLLSQDLKALVEDNWDWQVKRISDTDFSVICPTKASLTLCKNLCRNAGGIALPISKVSVLFADPQPHLRASAALAKIWVRLSDVPQCLRRADLLLEGTKMLGRPRMVDEESLAATEGPIRMLFHSQAPDRLPKSVLLFANLRGFRIGVAVEASKDAALPPSVPVEKRKDDGDDKGNDREQTEDQSQSDCHWKRQSSKAKEKLQDTGASEFPEGSRRACKVSTPPPQAVQAAPPTSSPPAAPVQGLHKVYQKKLLKKPGTKSSVGSSSVPAPSAKDQDHSATKPASVPAKFKVQPIPFNQYGSNLEEESLFGDVPILQPEAISMTIVLDDDSAPDSDELMDPCILKRSKFSAADRAEVGWESPEDWEFDNETLAAKIAKLKKKQDGEVDNPPSTPVQDLAKEIAAATQVAKAKRSMAMTSPLAGSRSSSRCKGSESEPIMQKAVKRAAAKSGTPNPSPLAPFLSLSASPDLHFLGVADDCGIVLGTHSSSASKMLSLIRAKEVCQAKIAEALEKAATKKAQLEKELLQENSGAPSTSAVGAPTVSTQGEGHIASMEEMESVTVASLIKEKKKKAPKVILPPRTNLRATPARQARALNLVQQ
jgi:hypothetical protein